MCACVRGARPLRPAAFLDGRGRHGRRGRYLASPSRNDKKARPPSHLLARSPAPPPMHHSHYLNYVEEYLKKTSEFEETGGGGESNDETATDLMVHLPHRSRSNSLVVRSELSTCGSRAQKPGAKISDSGRKFPTSKSEDQDSFYRVTHNYGHHFRIIITIVCRQYM